MGAGSLPFQMWANAEIQRHLDNAVEAEMHRQQGFQRMATPLFNANLAASSPSGFAQQLGQQRGNYAMAYRNLGGPVVYGMAQPGERNAAPMVGAYVGMAGGNTAAVQGLQNVWRNYALNNADFTNRMGLITSRARGSAEVLPAEMRSALRSAQDIQNIAMIMQAFDQAVQQGGGMVASMYGGGMKGGG